LCYGIAMRVVILGAVLALSITAVAQPSPNKQPNHPSAHNENSDYKSSDIPIAATPTKQNVPLQAPTPEKQDDSNQGSSSKADWWTRISNLVMAVATVALAVIGAIAACAAIRTLRVIERQTVATEEAAETASSSAKIAINAERPLLLVEIEPSKKYDGEWVFYAINEGRTAAELYEGHFECKLQRVGDFIPNNDFFELFGLPVKALTVHKDRFEIGRPRPRLMRQPENEPWPMLPHAYGRLYYWDTFTNRSDPNTKPHETWFLFRYDPNSQNWLRLKEYTKHT
jgi:hypothetical protein